MGLLPYLEVEKRGNQMIKDANTGELLNVGLNGEIVEGISAKGKEYKAYNIFWVNPDGSRVNVKQVFLSELELQMLAILQQSLAK